MLGKLLKYEFKSTARLLGVIYLAVLAVAAIAGLVGGISMRRSVAGDDFTNTLGMAILVLVYVILVVAMIVVSLILILERFYNNLLKGEGYLMHTLPVPTWMHVAAKTISAVVWYALAAAVLFLSLILALACSGSWQIAWSAIRWTSLFDAIADKKAWIILLIACALVQMIRVTLMFYLSMAIGGCATRHKIFYSGLAFICLLVIIGILGLVGNINLLFGNGVQLLDNSTGLPAGGLLGRQIITDLIYSGIFFWLTQFILKRKLNLE